MSYALFQDKKIAQQYIDKCNLLEGLPKAGIPASPYPYGWTISWDTVNINKDETLFAVTVHEKINPTGANIVEKLPDDWSEAILIR